MTKPELKLECLKFILNNPSISKKITINETQYKSEHTPIEDLFLLGDAIYTWISDNTDDADVFQSKVLTEKYK